MKILLTNLLLRQLTLPIVNSMLSFMALKRIPAALLGVPVQDLTLILAYTY